MAGYALLCPGQGSQHPAMLDLALQTAAGRAALEEASAAAGLDIAKRVRAGENLFEPVFAQVCLVATQLATWRALAPLVPAPEVVAGYSVGEVSSWSCAGTWTVAEAIGIVHHRALLMRDASPAGCAMLAVTGIDGTRLATAAGAHVAIVVDAQHHILAGPGPALAGMAEALEAAGATLRPLPVGVPSHTPLLAAAAEGLLPFLQSRAGRAPSMPVARGIDGRLLYSAADAPPALAEAVRRTIRWDAVQRELREFGVHAALELPPGSALARMISAANGVAARAVADFRSAEGVAAWVERTA